MEHIGLHPPTSSLPGVDMFSVPTGAPLKKRDDTFVTRCVYAGLVVACVTEFLALVGTSISYG